MKKIFKVLFIVGLLFEAIGQILLSKGNDFVYALKPIDFAHWSLLVGVVLMTPQIANFPNKTYTYIGIPITMIGVVSMIGMCVLDFIWWSYPTHEARLEFSSHISKVPSIWTPFITTGTRFLNVGLLILSFNYFKKNKLGFYLVVLATLIIFFGRFFISFRLIYAYFVYALGFGLIFYQKVNEYKT